MFDLEGKIAVVTGAAGQLGSQYVKALLNAGACVAAFDIDPDKPESGLMYSESKRLIRVKVDVTRKSEIQVALTEVLQRFGSPNILINNAAIDAPPISTEQETGPFEDYPESSWQMMMDVNLKGVFLCCQVIGGTMVGANGGSIINIASIYGILSPDQRIYEYKAKDGKPFYKPVAYCVTKSGILNLTRYLATYWAEQQIRVNTLILGGVYDNQDDKFLRNYSAKVPLGRMARVDEYNGAIIFLASDASSYMTGASLVIDGGFSCW